jgi:hypothetical protein
MSRFQKPNYIKILAKKSGIKPLASAVIDITKLNHEPIKFNRILKVSPGRTLNVYMRSVFLRLKTKPYCIFRKIFSSGTLRTKEKYNQKTGHITLICKLSLNKHQTSLNNAYA